VSACGHQFVGEAVCEHCGAYEREHFLHRIAELTRERDEARTLAAMWHRIARDGGTVNVTIGEPLRFNARGAFDDLDKDGDK